MQKLSFIDPLKFNKSIKTFSGKGIVLLTRNNHEVQIYGMELKTIYTIKSIQQYSIKAVVSRIVMHKVEGFISLVLNCDLRVYGQNDCVIYAPAFHFN